MRARHLLAVAGLLVFLAGGAGIAAPLDDIRRAEALIEVERFDLALALLKGVEIQGAEEAQRLDLALGRIYLGTGKASQAVEFFERASTATMDDAEGLAGLAQAELAMGRLADAGRDASAALRSDSGAVAPRLVLARIQERLGKRAEGERQLATLARDLPDSEEVAVARASFTAVANRSGALAQLDDFVRRHPFAARAEDALGALQWALGKRDIALEHRRHAAQQFAAQGDAARAEAIGAWIAGAQTLPVETRPEPPTRPGAPPQATPPLREASIRTPPSSEPGQPPAIVSNLPPAWPFKPEWSGSGIVLEGGRLILTNRHVVETGVKFAARNGRNQMRTGHVYAASKRADLALIELDEPFPDEDGFPLSLLVAPKAGRRILVMGYPLGEGLGGEAPTLTDGSVNKESGIEGDPTTFQMTARIQHGSSGGPVFDVYGDLVGVSVSGLTGKEISFIWFAVNADSIAEFLKVSLVSEPPSRQEVDPEGFYQQALGRVVFVVGRK